jgi:hypothetical protein
MFVLLSSQASPRYKEDILRCLAAPVNGIVQFRYKKDLVTDEVIAEFNNPRGRQKGPFGEAIVCFVDTTAQGVSPILPVRLATIDSATVHGTTLSLTLRMKGLADADTDPFTQQISQLSGNVNPVRLNNDLTGRFFFKLAGKPTGVNFQETLSQWERVVTKVQQSGTFANEAFFWTVVGTEEPSSPVANADTLQAWSDTINPSASRNLLIYHYRPQAGDNPDAKLVVKPGGSVQPGSPEVIRVDSRYDLHRWLFKTGHPDWSTNYGWINVQFNDGWSLDLPANVRSSFFWIALTVILAGLFISLPNLLGVVQQHANELDPTFSGPPHWWFIIKAVTALISGPLAVLVVLIGAPRLRP